MNLFICTPAYNGLMHIDYVNSLIDFHKHKIPFSMMAIGNESLIPRGRDTCISYFHDMKEFTHLLWLDADIGIRAEDLIKMINYKVDVIGAPVALKGFDERGNKVYNVRNPRPSIMSGLYECDWIGTAVLMMSRTVVEKLILDAEPYQNNKFTVGGRQLTMYNVFKVGVKDGVYMSEDFYVCEQMRKLGFKIYVDASVATIHNGMARF